LANISPRAKESSQRAENFLPGPGLPCFSRASHNPNLNEVADELEQAVAEIQFLGSPDLIGLVQAFSEEFAQNKSASLDEAIVTIRKYLRRELGEKPVSGKIIHLRIERPPKSSTTRK
jgi:hypothetical protein